MAKTRIAGDADEATASIGEESPSLLRRAVRIPELGVLGGLVLIIVLFTAWQPGHFATLLNLKNLLTDSSILTVLAMATTFVIVSGQIDLSIGGIIAFSEMATALTFRSLGGTAAGTGALFVGFVVALGSGLCWGALNGVLVTRLKLPPFVATLAILGIAQGAAYVLNDGSDLATVPNSLSVHIGTGSFAGIPMLVWIAVVVTLVATYVLRRTLYGRYCYAVGSDLAAAEHAGIRVHRHVVGVYAIAGLAYGFAAYLNLALYSTTSVAGHGTDALNAITAVALGGASLFGGVGTTLGSLIGVFIPGVLQNGLVIANVQPFYAEMGTGVALVLALSADQLRRSRDSGR
jgi:ribose transport system permease protein